MGTEWNEKDEERETQDRPGEGVRSDCVEPY